MRGLFGVCEFRGFLADSTQHPALAAPFRQARPGRLCHARFK